MRNNGSLPVFVIEQKCESAVQDKYRKMYKNLQPSHQHYRVKKQAALRTCLAYDNCKHEYGDHYMYSESVPLLHKEKDPRCSIGFFERSLTLLTF